MSDKQDERTPLVGMRDALPGYYRPGADEIATWMREGIIALDANVLLDAYRYSPGSRTELLRVLTLVKDRIFLPHQAAVEFHRNRIGALADHVAWFDTQVKVLETVGKQGGDALRGVMKQCQATTSQSLREAIDELGAAVVKATAAVRQVAEDYDLDVPTALSDDHILRALDELLDGSVGPQLSAADYAAALLEAKTRADKQTPPGWKDAHKKDPEVAAGDYLMWVQLIAHTREVGRPLLLITRDVKEDWTRRERGLRAGTHPHLVKEMLDEAGVPFAAMTPTDLMREAARVFDAGVSERTFTEISELDAAALRRLDDSIADPADWDVWLQRNHPELLLKFGTGGTVSQGQMRELLGPLFEEAAGYRSVGSTWPKQVRELFLRRAGIADERGELLSLLRAAETDTQLHDHLQKSGHMRRIQTRLESLDDEESQLLAEITALPQPRSTPSARTDVAWDLRTQLDDAD
jgi:hypothetical protein